VLVKKKSMASPPLSSFTAGQPSDFSLRENRKLRPSNIILFFLEKVFKSTLSLFKKSF
jgi:hypothetical protein